MSRETRDIIKTVRLTETENEKVEKYAAQQNKKWSQLIQEYIKRLRVKK